VEALQKLKKNIITRSSAYNKQFNFKVFKIAGLHDSSKESIRSFIKILNKVGSDGLQMCIDKLYNYCTKWGLQINIKKTKSVVFNNTGKLHDKIFNVNNLLY
jgi:hypothetical protein